MRLDTYLRHVCGMTKKDAQTHIKQGLIRCNDRLIIDPKHPIKPREDRVFLGVQPLVYEEHYTYMVHKPHGVITAHRDPYHPTVFDVIDVPHHPGLHAMGRLDKDTTGLLILTTDGALTHTVMHGKKKLGKRYTARLDRPFKAVDALRAPMRLIDGQGLPYTTTPAHVHSVKNDTVTLTIFEGKTHQVKKMFAQCGYEVVVLHREAIGGLELAAALRPGDSLRLTSEQCQLLKEAA